MTMITLSAKFKSLHDDVIRTRASIQQTIGAALQAATNLNISVNRNEADMWGAIRKEYDLDPGKEYKFVANGVQLNVVEISAEELAQLQHQMGIPQPVQEAPADAPATPRRARDGKR